MKSFYLALTIILVGCLLCVPPVSADIIDDIYNLLTGGSGTDSGGDTGNITDTSTSLNDSKTVYKGNTVVNIAAGVVTFGDLRNNITLQTTTYINDEKFIPITTTTEIDSLIYTDGISKSAYNTRIDYKYTGSELKETIILTEDKKLSFPITLSKGAKIIPWGERWKIVSETDQSSGLISGVPFGIDAAGRNVLMKYTYDGSNLNLEYSRDIYIYNSVLTEKTHQVEKTTCYNESEMPYICDYIVPQYDHYNITYPLKIDPAWGEFGVANFTSNVTCAAVGEPIQFNDTSTGTATQWRWWFGDEAYSNEAWTQMNASPAFLAGFGQPNVLLPNGDIIRIGEDGLSQNNLGVWKSSDMGVLWTEINQTFPNSADGQTRPASITSDGIIYAISSNKLYNSSDNGVTWNLVNMWNSYRYGVPFVILPNDHFVLFVGSNPSMRDVYLSTNRGETWTLVNNSPGWTNRTAMSAGLTINGSIIVHGGENGVTYYDGVWISLDEGYTWTKQTDTSNLATSRKPLVTLPDGTLFLLGGMGGTKTDDIYVSYNDGINWTREDANPAYDNKVIGLNGAVVLKDGSILFAGGYSTANTNDTWRLNVTSQVLNSSAVLQNPIHSYSSTGLKTVALIASDSTGYNWSTKRNYINISSSCPEEGGSAPVSSFTTSRTLTRIPREISVNDTSTNTPTSWSYNWGDGSTAGTTANSTHIYYKRGLWSITLNATNAFGSNISTVTQVRVIGYDN